MKFQIFDMSIKRFITFIFSLLIVCSFTKANASDQPLIFPVPQEMDKTNDFFKVDENVQIVLPAGASKKDVNLARLLIRELSIKY